MSLTNDPARCQCPRCLTSPEGQCRFPHPTRTIRCEECRRTCTGH